MGVVKEQVTLVSDWSAFFLFHTDQKTIPQYSYFEN